MAENVKVNYIYADAEEKYVKTTVLYHCIPGSSNNLEENQQLCYDKEGQHPVNGLDLKQLFLKGFVIEMAPNEYRAPLVVADFVTEWGVTVVDQASIVVLMCKNITE